MKFRTVILEAKKTATGIEVPAEIIEKLNAGKKPAVTITVNGYSYRSTVAVMGGKYMVGLSAEHRKASGIAGGDAVEVSIELDTKPREVTVPADFAAAMKKNAAAKKFFETLSYSNKQRHVLSIEQVKTEETRLKRIDKAIAMLEAGHK